MAAPATSVLILEVEEEDIGGGGDGILEGSGLGFIGELNGLGF